MKSNMKKILYTISVAAMLSSCGIYTTYHRPADLTTQNLTGDRVVEVSADSLPAWQEFFSDPALRQLIEQGLKNNTNLQTAQLKVTESQASLTAARLAFLPTLALSPSGTLSSFDGKTPSKIYSLPVAASWQLDVFGSLRNAKERSKAVYEQTKSYKQAVQAQLIATIANDYYTLLLLDSQLKISEQTKENWRQLVDTYRALMQKDMPPNRSGRSAAVRNVIRAAYSVLGTPYVFGGTSTYGFDCSGFTQYAFARAGISIPRMADSQLYYGRQISMSELRPGDLIFFSTYEPGASHCGIYLGDGKFIHAGTSTGVVVADAFTGYWGEPYYGACRVL